MKASGLIFTLGAEYAQVTLLSDQQLYNLP
jgi:hypothetical protein